MTATDFRQKQCAAQLSTTGVPTLFIVLHEIELDDCEAGEREVRDALDSNRVSDRRDFFAIESKRAVVALNELARAKTSASQSA